jgi:hypothetical protein
VQLNIRFNVPSGKWNFNVRICALSSVADGVATDARAFIPSQRVPGDERTGDVRRGAIALAKVLSVENMDGFFETSSI